MKIFKEKTDFTIGTPSLSFQNFRYEVEPGTENSEITMHKYFIENRNTIFGQFIYLLHEVSLGAESSIDFIGFTKSGAVLLIEIKRKLDSRNRQEVISQIGKYALDAFSINNLLQDEKVILELINRPYLRNKKLEATTLTQIKNNIQQNNINLFLLTEEATDEVLASAYYLSYGARNRKITVIELKRFTIGDDRFCSLRFYNDQPLLNSSRKGKEDLLSKIDRIEDPSLKNRIIEHIQKWQQRGWSIDPLTVSTPQYFTFLLKPGYSMWVYYYVQNLNRKNLSGIIRKNSIVFQVNMTQNSKYRSIIEWLEQQKNYYALKSENKGKAKDYFLHCVDVSDYSNEELSTIFDKLNEIAIKKKKGEF